MRYFKRQKNKIIFSCMILFLLLYHTPFLLLASFYLLLKKDKKKTSTASGYQPQRLRKLTQRWGHCTTAFSSRKQQQQCCEAALCNVQFAMEAYANTHVQRNFGAEIKALTETATASMMCNSWRVNTAAKTVNITEIISARFHICIFHLRLKTYRHASTLRA